jgi:hypothetical protein
MKIYKSTSNQIAEKDGSGFFVCGLKKKDKTLSKYVSFPTIEEAASFLLSNPTWGIRMNPNWSLIHRDIVIERDG